MPPRDDKMRSDPPRLYTRHCIHSHLSNSRGLSHEGNFRSAPLKNLTHFFTVKLIRISLMHKRL